MTRTNILITGASSGLGAEMARQFAAMGRNLALVARRLDRLTELRQEIRAARPELTVTVRELDVNDHDAVFRVFRECADDLGALDRIVVNAGLGKGQPIGTGSFAANRQTAQTNFVGALAQCEAAMEYFRERDAGHLVVISSMSGLRGFPRNLTTYAASKAAVATLAEGIRVDVLRRPIAVTTVYPGYIRSEMNEKVAGRLPMMVNTEVGVRSIVRAVEREPATAYSPAWPWRPLSVVLRFLPLSVLSKLS